MNGIVIDRIFLETAVRVAESVRGSEGQNEILSFVAVKYAESGELDAAVEVTNTIDDTYEKDHVLGLVAAASVSADAADYADELLEMIEDDAAHGIGIEQLAVAYAQAGEIEKAIEVVQRRSESSTGLSRIALVCVAHDREAEALEVLRTIDYPDVKIPIYIELAAKAVSQELFPKALDLLVEATEAAEAIEYSASRIEAWIAVASLYRSAGEEDQAAEILSRALRDCAEAEGLDQDEYRARIAIAYADGGRFQDADRLIEEIENPFQFAHATANVALSHHKAGDSVTARRLLTDALETVRDEEVYGAETLAMRETLLGELASYHVITGRFEEALKIAGLMTTPDRFDITLRDLAGLCVELGHNGQAFRVLEMITEDPDRVLCEARLIEAFTKSDQPELADRTLAQASVRVSAIEEPFRKAEALIELVPCFVRRQQPARAAETLFEALETSTLIPDIYRMGRVLMSVAVFYGGLLLAVGEREKKVLEEITNKLD